MGLHMIRLSRFFLTVFRLAGPLLNRLFCPVFLVLLPACILTGCANLNPELQVTANSFDFGPTVVAQQATRDVVTITNPASVPGTLTEKLSGDPSLTLDPGLSCGPTLVAGGSCSMVVTFLPTKPGAISGSLALILQSSQGSFSQSISLTGTGVQITAGSSLVTATACPVVALYTFQPEMTGSVAVEFGTDTSYGRTTGSVPTSANLGPVGILVAGMQQNTTYHMRAVLTASDGTVTEDSDHTFTTGSFPSGILQGMNVSTATGATPQPGIELEDAALSLGITGWLEAYATDLSGDVIWGYNFPDRPTANTIIQPIKLLPNGNFLVTISFPSQYLIPGQGETLTPADASVDLIREIDLAGDPVEQITLATLNQKLAAAGYTLTVSDFHHDVAVLPNGHFIAIASVLKSFTNLVGYPGTTTVLGDALVDLDQNFNVTWVWNEFDHLDVNRHPMNFPDWTHTNAVIYSPDDGNLLVSIRHQSWIVKVDYENGAGSGNILWTLGEGGDFTLSGGTAPQDWFYAQHGPSFVGAATAGQFSLTMMDNGDNRILADGNVCGDTADPCYTTVPVLAINEAAKTAAITFRQTIPSAEYSEWGGNAEALPNGDLEYDLCAEPSGDSSDVDEITIGTNPQTVWTLEESGASLYRAQRIPSLYHLNPAHSAGGILIAVLD